MKSSSFAQAWQRFFTPKRRDRRRNKLHVDCHPSIEQLEDRKLLTVTPLTNWKVVQNTTPGDAGIGTMILLSDGTVMMQQGLPFDNDQPTNTWVKLTPDSLGNYANGTFSQLANSNVGRLFYASNVLQDGRVFVLGGEFSTAGDFTNTGEIYNPVTNTWTATAPYPQAAFGDDPTEILPNGNILAGNIVGPQTFIYNPNTNTWSNGGTKQRLDQSDEETWVKLPDNSILSYDVFASTTNGLPTAQRYIPATNTWVKAGFPPKDLSGGDFLSPNILFDPPFFELGPAVLLQNGKVFATGATGATALYNPKTNAWTNGPTIPLGMSPDDAPAAVLPDGNVIFAADSGIIQGQLGSAPQAIFEYHPSSNTITQVALPVQLAGDAQFGPAFLDRMLVLPTGQMLFTDGVDNQLFIYSENLPQTGPKPVISSISGGGGGNFILTGTRLNGPNEGASYGDDAEMSSNYPIVYLKNSAGQVFYARTSNWSLTGVATGNQLETVDFTLPSGIAAGTYTLFVSGAGVSSAGRRFVVPGSTTSSSTASTAVKTTVKTTVVSNTKTTSNKTHTTTTSSKTNTNINTKTNSNTTIGLGTIGGLTSVGAASPSSKIATSKPAINTTTVKTGSTATNMTVSLSGLDSAFAKTSLQGPL